MSERIAFLGIGLMGAPMAERLVAAGRDLDPLEPHARQSRDDRRRARRRDAGRSRRQMPMC